MTAFTLPAWLLRLAPAGPRPRPAPTAPAAFDLPAGQSATLDLRPGQALRVAAGRVRVRSAPRALGDVAVQVAATLGQGECYASADREAVVVTALGNERSRIERLR